MTKKYKRNCIVKSFACVLSAVLSITAIGVSVYADEPIYGTVAVQTQTADEYEIVYENHFDAETDFTNYYNKSDSAYPIYPNAGNEFGVDSVKYTASYDFSSKLSGFGNPVSGSVVRTFNGDSKSRSKGFWVDLDKVLKDNGPGTYKFSFRVTAKSGNGLVEGCLNTLENQSDLGKLLWNIQSDWGTPAGEDIVGGVNVGGHVLCKRWDESVDVNQQVFESITYIPEDAKHLRFLFGCSVDKDTAHNIGGNGGWLPIAMDDLVIYKKVNSAESGSLNLTSTVVSLDGNEHIGRLVSTLYDDRNALISSDVSDETTIGAEKVEILSSLNVPGGYDETYTIKTFFADIDSHIVPYGISYNPLVSLFPNYNFESPLANDYRILKYSEPITTSSNSAYTGKKGIELKLDVGDTYFAVGEGEILTKDGVNASTTAFAKAVWENGKGKYRISFMAKTTGDDATIMAQIRRHIFSTSKQDTIGGNGSIEVTPHVHSEKQTITNHWSEIQLEVDIVPMTPWGGAGEYVSYRRNNYPLKLIVNGTGLVYIDDLKIEKIS